MEGMRVGQGGGGDCAGPGEQDNGGLDPGDSGGDGEKWVDWVSILKVEQRILFASTQTCITAWTQRFGFGGMCVTHKLNPPLPILLVLVPKTSRSPRPPPVLTETLPGKGFHSSLLLTCPNPGKYKNAGTQTFLYLETSIFKL